VVRQTRSPQTPFSQASGGPKIAGQVNELEALIGDKFTASQREFLDEWDKLPADVRRHLRAVVKAWAGEESASTLKRPRTRQR